MHHHYGTSIIIPISAAIIAVIVLVSVPSSLVVVVQSFSAITIIPSQPTKFKINRYPTRLGRRITIERTTTASYSTTGSSNLQRRRRIGRINMSMSANTAVVGDIGTLPAPAEDRREDKGSKNTYTEENVVPVPDTLALPVVASELSVSSTIRSTVDPCVVLMKQLIQKHQTEYQTNHPEDTTIYSLAQGVVYWEPPTECHTAMINSFTDTTQSSNLHLYSPDEGLFELRQLLLTKIANENQLTNHDIIVTSGANQAYMNCVLSILSSDDSYAVIFAPYYFNHYMALQMTIGTENVFIGHLTPNEKLPDIHWLREQFLLHNTDSSTNRTTAGATGSTTKKQRNIRMITITNPCNPTGIAYTKEQIQPFVDLCRQYSCYLILDATYEYFVHHNNSSSSSSSSNSFTSCFNHEEHVIHIFSLSKSYAMAGYRIGYMVLPRRNDNNSNNTNNETTQEPSALYDNVMKVQDTIAIAPSRIGQIAAIGALQHGAGQQWVQQKVQTLSVGRIAIYDALQVLQPNVIGGTGAMYFMAQLPTNNTNDDGKAATTSKSVNDIEIAEQLIQLYGVAVIPGTFCGAPGWIRICYANLPPDQCIVAAQRLRQGLQELVASSN